MAHHLDLQRFPAKTVRPEGTIVTTAITFGGSGAVASESADRGVSTKKTGTGEYTIAFPACDRAIVIGCELVMSSFGNRAAAPKTVAASGSAVITTSSAGSAANATSGDILHVALLLMDT